MADSQPAAAVDGMGSANHCSGARIHLYGQSTGASTCRGAEERRTIPAGHWFGDEHAREYAGSGTRRVVAFSRMGDKGDESNNLRRARPRGSPGLRLSAAQGQERLRPGYRLACARGSDFCGLAFRPFFARSSSLISLYSNPSTRACQDASMMFSLMPTVP